MPPFPGAVKTVQIWAGYNGASDPVTDAAPSLDLTTDVAGLDTVVTRYTNCPPGGAVELWTINGGGHVPTLSSEFSPGSLTGSWPIPSREWGRQQSVLHPARHGLKPLRG